MRTLQKLLFAIVFLQIFSFAVFAQIKDEKLSVKSKVALPEVTRVDGVALTNLLKPNGKPLLINFWATWCDPCREEFPDLVKIDTEYKGKLDFITVSLDDLAEINGDVPKFLASMKAEMPAYLLKTTNEDAVISSVSKDWQGALPFTILYDASGKTVYSKMGKVKIDVLRTEIEKSLVKELAPSPIVQIGNLPLNRVTYTYQKGVADAKKDISEGKLIIRYFGLRPAATNETLVKSLLKKKYDIEINNVGCLVSEGYDVYAKGYNEVSITEIKRRFGDDYLEKAISRMSK